jgi:hypothetical protein
MLGKRLNNEEKLDAIYEMTLENHHMIKSLQRQQYFSTAARIFYWLVILAALFGAYYYIRPIVLMISENKGRVEDGINQLETLKNQLPETGVINQLIDGLQKSATGFSPNEKEKVEAFEVVQATTTQ